MVTSEGILHLGPMRVKWDITTSEMCIWMIWFGKLVLTLYNIRLEKKRR